VKKIGVLNRELSAVIGAMGHTDLLVVADAGLPVPPGVRCVDLAVVCGLPGVIDVLRAIALELQVEELTIAEELLAGESGLAESFREVFPGVPVSAVPHEAFKAMSGRARAVVRTGECTPYANVILTSGVTF
jgi:D-ribose pyranase